MEEERQKETNGRRLRLILALVLVAAVLGSGVYGFVYGLELPKDFLNKTAALTLETFHDVLGSGGGGKLAAEIDLANGESRPVVQAAGTVSFGAAEGRANEEAVFAPQTSGGGTDVTSDDTSGRSSLTGPSEANSKNDVAPTQASLAKTVKIDSAPASICGFATEGEPTHKIIFNEIAWMGSVPRTGETAAQAANNEWLELKNISRDDIDLAGWQVLDASEKFKIVFGDGDRLSAGGFYLMERTDDNSVPVIKANKIYSGALSNSGMNLRLFGGDCALVDEINVSSSWPSGDNSTKATMEWNSGDFGWHTSAILGGTPKAENSLLLLAATTSPSQILSQQNLGGQATTSDIYYTIGVSFQGDGSGTVTSTPSGIYCGTDCVESFRQGTLLAFTATPDNNSALIGWSGACGLSAGTGTCSFVVTSTASVVAVFRSLVPVSQPAPPPAEISTNAVNHLVIAAVQIAGASTTNDFVKIYNPTSVAVDIGGWKLRKKTQTAADYTSVRVFASGNMIQPQEYFLWANSENSFAQNIGANESSTQTLAANNSLALLDGAGIIIDAVAWGSGHTNPYIEGSAYPDNPVANQVLSRKFVNGLIVDTDNNAANFEIH